MNVILERFFRGFFFAGTERFLVNETMHGIDRGLRGVVTDSSRFESVCSKWPTSPTVLEPNVDQFFQKNRVENVLRTFS